MNSKDPDLMRELRFTQDDLNAMERIPRLTLVNGLSGFKSASLIGTVSQQGEANLGIFNTVIHIGSDPALLGFLMRPTHVERHTYSNFKEVGFCTINLVPESIFRQAHQTSAKYGRAESEFEAVGLTPLFSEAVRAPYVQECPIRIGLAWEEEHRIQANETRLLIGRVIELFLPEAIYHEDGWLDLDMAGLVTVAGLDTYYRMERLARLGFARPGRPLEELNNPR